ncbi:hypothetical protein AKAW_11428, partial [Aspergillus luchuensis IFO 4308]
LLCIPNEDVQADFQADGELRLHWTAIDQVLAFALQALAVEPRTPEEHGVAHDNLSTRKVEFDVLSEISEASRKDPQASSYWPSHWKRVRKRYNTRACARCQPGASTPKHSSIEGSGTEQ